MWNIIKHYFIPLLLTIVIEDLILFILKEKRKKVYLASILINIITNLSLNLFISNIIFSSINHYFLIIIPLELFIWILEGISYFLLIKDIKKSISYTLFCNSASFIIGLCIQFFFFQL